MLRKGMVWTPDMDARAREMRAQDTTWTAIARALGVSMDTVRYHLLPEVRSRILARQNARRARRAPSQPLAVRIPADALKHLNVAAKVRGTDARSLANRILEDVLLGGLVDAVLDDGTQTPEVAV